jgi:hypothetical protein
MQSTQFVDRYHQARGVGANCRNRSERRGCPGARMSDLVVEDQADEAPATLTDLERLQDQVLAELDALAQRIEDVLKEFGRGSPNVGGDVEPDYGTQS